MHITVYHAYIALHISYIYHLSRTAIPYTSAYKRAYAPLYTPCPTHKRRSADGDMPEKARKKCGYRRTRYAPYMVGFSHSAQKNRLHNG